MSVAQMSMQMGPYRSATAPTAGGTQAHARPLPTGGYYCTFVLQPSTLMFLYPVISPTMLWGSLMQERLQLCQALLKKRAENEIHSFLAVPSIPSHPASSSTAPFPL